MKNEKKKKKKKKMERIIYLGSGKGMIEPNQ